MPNYAMPTPRRGTTTSPRAAQTLDHCVLPLLPVPAERGLQRDVLVGNRGVARDDQPPPDQQTDPVQHDQQLVDVAVRADISIDSHRLILGPW